MSDHHKIENKITIYTMEFLKVHFGASPLEIEVIYPPPFLLIHLKEFLLAPETLLMRSGEENRIVETQKR